MGGFDYFVFAPPEEALRIDATLEDLRTWMRQEGYIGDDGYDYTGLTRYGAFKDVEDPVWFDKRGNVVKRVKDLFPKKVVEEIKRGNWCMWWMEITWFHRIPMRILVALKSLCEKKGCMRFYLDLIEAGETRHSAVFGMLRGEFSKLGVEMRETRAGWDT